MKKKFVSIFIFIFMLGYLFYPGLKGEAVGLLKRKRPFWINHQPSSIEQPFSMMVPVQMPQTQDGNEWELPFPYAQTSWPAIHRDSRNSNYLPFGTARRITSQWHGLQSDYAAVMSPVVIGPEGNVYFITGKEEDYGNLHAFSQEGYELWRSHLLDTGAFCSPPLVDRQGDLYIGDLDEFFSFHPDGSEKWRSSDLEGPFPSSIISLDGYIVTINRDGLIYVFDPEDGYLAAAPFELPGQSPGEDYWVAAPMGLWEGMVNESESLTITDIYNIYKGHQFKITKVPAMDPYSGRIYLAGTAKSDNYSYIQGKIYGLDLVKGEDEDTVEVNLAFEGNINEPVVTSPCLSPNGLHIYLIGQSGTFYALDKDGKKIWDMQFQDQPLSPTIGEDGIIYVAGGSKLSAISDQGNAGSILWEIDFKEIIIDRLLNYLSTLNDEVSSEWLPDALYAWRDLISDLIPDSLYSFIPDSLLNFIPGSLFNFIPYDWPGLLGDLFPSDWINDSGFPGLSDLIRNQNLNPTIISNSLVSASKNYLYLALTLGYETKPSGGENTQFMPVRNYIAVLDPYGSVLRPSALIKSFASVPDTSDGILTLDKNGKVFCTHASIGSSVAYFTSNKMGLNLNTPTGGISVLSPVDSGDLFSTYIESANDSIAEILQILRSGDLEAAYGKVKE